jgi:2-oxoglutarate ferredoxin oxidoreductase subunit beta
VPAAIGAKLANQDLTVIIVGGDGDGYGEGLNHFVHALRGNVDVTYLVHNNSVYGLTTGQASPTSQTGFKGKSTPDGLIDSPLNPLAVALAAGASFVARGFAGHEDHLVDIMTAAIKHKGFSFVDMFQPCVTFNKLNTYAFYYDLVYSLQDDKSYSTTDRKAALLKALETEKMATGILYQNAERKDYRAELSYLNSKSLLRVDASKRHMSRLFKEFI